MLVCLGATEKLTLFFKNVLRHVHSFLKLLLE